MRRFALAAVFGLVASLLLVGAARAGGQLPVALYLTERYTAQPVDWQTWCGDCGPNVDYTTQEPWTVNPGWVPGYMPPIALTPVGGTSNHDNGCLFDSDDWFEYHVSGDTFAPNTTLVATECRWRGVGRFEGGELLYLRFQSASPDLIVTASWDWGAGSADYTFAPVPGQGQLWTYGYGMCLLNPLATGGVYVPVPGSHDGSAIWELVTITITNPTSRKVGKTSGFFGDDFRSNSLWCPGGIDSWIYL